MQGKPGEIISIGEKSIHVALQGGAVEIAQVRTASGGKIAADFAHAHGLRPHDRLESFTPPPIAITS